MACCDLYYPSCDPWTIMKIATIKYAGVVLCLVGGTFVFLHGAGAAPPSALSQAPVPIPDNIADFVADSAAAVRLGKALFWDMQLGSSGDMACASCHFHAGTDNRAQNQISPNLQRRNADNTPDPDTAFSLKSGVNATLTAADFPLYKIANPEDRTSAVISDTNNICGSQGVPLSTFVNVIPGNAREVTVATPDPLFAHNIRDTRRVTGRNTPTTINAVFNFTNFLDGRANPTFNGVNPFGIQDVNAKIWVNAGGMLEQVKIILNNASLASQAVGPPLSDVEMSAGGRTFPMIGRKMLSLAPLARQVVHPGDSTLGPIANSHLTPDAGGIADTYVAMVQKAFLSKYWDSDQKTPDGFTQMEANFSLFFGLAVMMYERTLVADDTPFDRFLVTGDDSAFDPVIAAHPKAGITRDKILRGMEHFFSLDAGCLNCHFGPELTAASVSAVLQVLEPGTIEVMDMANFITANYDIGFYNIGVRPTAEDIGRGGKDPFGNPLSFARQAVMEAHPELFPNESLTFDSPFVPGCIPDFLATPINICPAPLTTVTRVNDMGTFKTPGLRNVELTGPYFHNGGKLTLKQVVEFYTRGGDFHDQNIDELDPFIAGIPVFQASEAEQDTLVAFLLALTDERVRWETAPFDHPQLFIPNGHSNRIDGNPKGLRRMPMTTEFLELPAVGAGGRAAENLGPIAPFLWDGTDVFHFGN